MKTILSEMWEIIKGIFGAIGDIDPYIFMIGVCASFIISTIVFSYFNQSPRFDMTCIKPSGETVSFTGKLIDIDKKEDNFLIRYVDGNKDVYIQCVYFESVER